MYFAVSELEVTKLERKHISLWIDGNILKKSDANMKIANMKNRSDYVEAALEFYNGYLHGRNNEQFVGKTLMNTFQSTMNNFEKRMSRQMFKQAVETSKLFWLMVRRLNISPEDVDDLHYECVDEVKRINGAINFPYRSKGDDE